jgi:RNA polymerase sigma-70 factor, ECF subfamily
VNRPLLGGVLLRERLMGGYLTRLATEAGLPHVEQELDQEFEARLVETSTLAFRVAYGVLRHRQDAEDVAQEAFAKAYRSFRQLRDRDRFRAWLVRMTWRLALNFRRGEKRRTVREDTHALETAAFDGQRDEADSRDRVAEIWRAIDALPEKLRVVVVLANIEGHEIRDVAQLLEIPEGTVKSRLFEARRQLKEQLS